MQKSKILAGLLIASLPIATLSGSNDYMKNNYIFSPIFGQGSCEMFDESSPYMFQNITDKTVDIVSPSGKIKTYKYTVKKQGKRDLFRIEAGKQVVGLIVENFPGSKTQGSFSAFAPYNSNQIAPACTVSGAYSVVKWQATTTKK